MTKVLMLSAILFLPACAQADTQDKPSGSVFDRRDPEVVRAVGTVEGIRAQTIPAMEKFLKRISLWAKAHPHPRISALLGSYKKELGFFEQHLANLEKNPLLGASMISSHPDIQELYRLIGEANKSYFALIQEIDRLYGWENIP